MADSKLYMITHFAPFVECLAASAAPSLREDLNRCCTVHEDENPMRRYPKFMPGLLGVPS